VYWRVGVRLGRETADRLVVVDGAVWLRVAVRPEDEEAVDRLGRDGRV
jgi:hypothetical protein